MANIAASVVINRVQATLIDVNIFWSAAEQLDALNAAITATVHAKRDAYVVTSDFTLAAGVEQTLPAGTVQLIGVIKGGAGAVRRIDPEKLAHAQPTWSTATAVANPSHYMYDIDNPLIFYNYPPAIGGGTMRLQRSAVPARLTATTDLIPLTDNYETALYFHCLAQAYGKNTVRGDLVKESGYLKQWQSELGLGQQSQDTEQPIKQREAVQ